MTAGAAFPTMSWQAVGGGTVAPADGDGWRMLVVYRGKHCPLCKRYLGGLNDALDDWREAGVDVAAISADPLERARAEVGEEGWRFRVGVDLRPDEMRQLGLYISDPRSPEETDRPFAEPAVFVLNPTGKAQVIDVSNAPFARSDLSALLDGLKFVHDKN